MGKLIGIEKSSHWYTKDGLPCFEVPKKDGLGTRSVTIKDARKLNLLPSVTTVLSILEKPQLTIWKQEMAILASLTLPRVEGESDDDFAKRVVIDAKQISKDAMSLGTRIHTSLEMYFNSQSQLDQDAWEYVHPVVVWIENNIDKSKPFEVEKRLASKELGFAGRTDLICYLKDGRKAMIDWKSKGTKEQYQHKMSFYNEECWQLSAYSMIEEVDCLINIGISTGKAGVIEVKEWTPEEVANGISIFKSALQLFKLIKGL